MGHQEKIFKYLLGIIMAALLNHAVESQDIYTDAPVLLIVERSADEVQYIVVVEADVSSTEVIEELKSSVASFIFPFQADNNTEVTSVNISTVCSLNETHYQCKCEDNYFWPNDTCQSYEACDDITDGSCTCINGLPSDGQLCQDINECPLEPKSVCGPYAKCINQLGIYSCSCLDGFTATNSSLPISIKNTCEDVNECLKTSESCGPNSHCTNSVGSYNCSCLTGFTVTNINLPVNNSNPCNVPLSVFEYETDIEMSFSDLSLLNNMRNFITDFSLPFTLNNANITDIDLTTVCGLNGTEYKCKCEKDHVWPNDTCRAYQVCDSIVGGTCGCIQAFPSEGPLCQRDINECEDAVSVCGQYSDCINTIGSHVCFCWTGFNTSNKDSPVSRNNSCQEASTTISPSTSSSPSSPPSSSLPPSSSSSSPTSLSSPTSSSSPSSLSLSSPTSSSSPSSPSLSSPTSPSSSSPTSSLSSPPSSLSSSTMSSSPPSTLISSPAPSTGSTKPLSSTTTMKQTVIGMSVKINQNFETSLSDPNSQSFKDLSGKIESLINSGYSDHLNGYIQGSAKISAFRPGSIIVDYTINTTSTSNSLNFVPANDNVSSSLTAQGINVTENAFSQSEQILFIKDQMYPLQQLILTCTQPYFAHGQIKWTVNDKDPALDMTRYSLSNDNSTLTVKSASESDSGQYSCIIETNTIPFIQWQNIVIKQRPNIIVGDKERVFPCDYSKSILLTCTVDSGYSTEWVVDESVQNFVQINDLGSNGIILNYTTQSGNCTGERFTCRLKNLTQLQTYSYSQNSVTVRKTQQAYDCINEELGMGTKGEHKNGACGPGMKGTITYICASNQIWTSLQNNCVLEVIDNLKTKVETILVGEIPQFMTDLSSATLENNNEITQSPATVQAIVDILFRIANLSNAILIDKKVMGSFLTTVDIIVSSNASDTWRQLNKGNTTNNTNIKLLGTIEGISDRLKDEFALTETSIQLNRTTVNNSFAITSTLPNSTTEIVIPHVLQETTVTIIIFTTLDNILPPRDTSNNGSGKPNVRINGDVVVVKVNETINNISFAFDINNASLGNPQCVFWNFSLNAWDSTGCEVKPINTGNETGKITCECDHTTSFSILMSPFFIDNIALAYITYIGVAISLASLILCLIIEAIVWKSMRRNDTSYIRHVSIVNIAFSLLIANICFIIGASIGHEDQSTPVGPCSAAVFFMHFFYLALFFWMLISALLLLYRTVMVLSQMSRAKMMVIAFTVGYGAPLLIAVITVASTAGPQNYVSKSDACWLNWSESKALLAFVIPALTIVTVNLVVLVVVVYKMLRRGTGARTQPGEKHTLVVIARFVAILTPIFGLTWGFGIGTMVSSDLGIHVVFALLNSLQGFFILVLGTLLDSKVREALPGKLSIQSLSSSRTRSTSAGLSSTSRLGFLQRRRRRNMFNVSQPNRSSPATSSDHHDSYSSVDLNT